MRMKLLSDGLRRNVMLRVESKDEILLRVTDEKYNVDGLKVWKKFLCEGLIRNVMSRG